MRCKRVHPRAAGIGQAEELCDLVVGFARRVVERLADVAIAPGSVGGTFGEIEMRVAARDDERKQRIRSGERSLSLHQHGMDVAFEMIDGNQRAVCCKSDGLGEGDADQQRSGEARDLQ